MADKKKVYVETSVISNLTARPSHEVKDAAMQVQTIEWWCRAAERYTLLGSQLVIDEASRGDATAAKRRLEAVKDLQILDVDERAIELADKLMKATAVHNYNQRKEAKYEFISH